MKPAHFYHRTFFFCLCQAYILLLGAAIFPPLAKADKRLLGDRLLLEINDQAFTQRQMEVYWAIKTLLSRKPEERKLVLDANNWLSARGDFQEDMIILLEIRRLGRLQAPKDKLEQQVGIVTQFLKHALPSEQAFFTRLNIDGNTIQQTVANIIQVEEYRRIKANALDSHWLQELEQKQMIRYLHSADTFREIQPEQGA